MFDAASDSDTAQFFLMVGSQFRAVVQTGYGNSSVLELRMINSSDPGPSEVRVRHSAIGVNFHDIYVRTGLYQTLTIPGVPGIEAVGVIIAVGPGSGDWRVGQRVAYVDRGYGAYCEERNVATSLLVEPPESLSDGVVATSLVRGLTAAMLLEQVYQVRPGDRCLIHAIAGSTGQMLASWARHIGAAVVGTVGKRPVPPEIAAVCDNIYSYVEDGWSERLVAEQGATFDYVCDSVGAPTFGTSLKAAKSCGHIALFGQSGGKVEQIDVDRLAVKSLTITRPILFDFIADAVRRGSMMRSLTDMVNARVLRFPDPLCLPLAKAGEAQAMLEERSVTAPIALIP